MNWGRRIFVSLVVTGVGGLVIPCVAFGFKYWIWDEFIAGAMIAFVLLLPVWFVLLPMIFYFERFNLLRGFAFLFAGGLAAPIILRYETLEFFNTARGNRMPDHAWFVREEIWVGACALVLCLVYVLIVRSARPAISGNKAFLRG